MLAFRSLFRLAVEWVILSAWRRNASENLCPGQVRTMQADELVLAKGIGFGTTAILRLPPGNLATAGIDARIPK